MILNYLIHYSKKVCLAITIKNKKHKYINIFFVHVIKGDM